MVKKSPEHQGNNNNNNNNNDNNNKGDNNNSIKYKGVRKRKWGKWVSEVRLPNSRERIWLGSYDTPEKAARAFDAAQFCLRGKSANFNFPNDPPEIAGGRSMTPLEIQAAAASFANMSPGDDGSSVVRDRSEENNPTMFEESAEALSYSSPSISDGTPVQMDSFEVAGVEASFQEQLSLSTTLGSGNYVSDFGYFTGFDEFTGGGDFFTMTQQPNNFDYVGQEDTYDASLYQNSYLWNWNF